MTDLLIPFHSRDTGIDVIDVVAADFDAVFLKGEVTITDGCGK